LLFPVEIKQDGSVDYVAFEQLSDGLRDMNTPLSMVSLSMLSAVEKQIESDGAYGLKPYQELSEKYDDWKIQHGSDKMLVGIVRTGEKWLTRPQTYTVSGKMRRELFDPASVKVIGNKMIYSPQSEVAGYQQTGTDTMPARPPVVTPVSLIDEWQDIFVGWVNSWIERVGL
jgi:hypothetical protein